MARLEGITRGGSLLTRLIFFLSRRSYGRVITPAKVYALDPALLLTIALMEEGQEHAKQMNAQFKLLTRMLVAWRIGYPWCPDYGTKTSEKLGVTDEQQRALPDYEHSSLLGEERRVVLHYADAMTRTPVQVPDVVFAAYVADLLSLSDIAALFTFAHRLQIPGGYLCLVSLTEGM